MFHFLSRHIYPLRFIILALGLCLLLIGIFYGAHVFDTLQSGGTEDSSSGSYRAEQELAAKFPRSQPSLIVLASSPDLTVDQPEFRDDYAQLIAAIKSDSSKPSVTAFTDPYQKSLIARDRHSAIALVSIPGSDDRQSAIYERIRAQLSNLNKPSRPTGGLPAKADRVGSALSIIYGGPAVANDEVANQVQVDLAKAGAISMPLLAILLLIIFRSAIAMLLPLILGAVSVLGAFSVTRLIAAHASISVFSAQIIGLLGLGLAIDYSLLFVSRFRDELAAGKELPDAVETTIHTAGEAIFFSGATVTLSLLGLLLFPQMFLRSMGLGGAIAVIMAMLVSLTVLPALLAVIGPNVDKLALPLPWTSAHGHEIGLKFWRRLGEFVTRHPVPVIVVTLGLLLAAGYPFLHVRFAEPGADSLPASFQSRASADLLTRDFDDDQNPPIEIVVDLPESPTSSDQLNALSTYVAQLERLPNAQDIHSLVSLDPRIPASDYYAIYNLPGISAAQEALSHLASGHSTFITVGYPGQNDDHATQRLVDAIRAIPPPPGSRVLVGGDTADLVDQLAGMRERLPIAAFAILGATFLVLLVMLSSLIIPLKAIVLNTLSLSAAFGLMTWIFQQGHFQNLLHYTSSGSLDPTLPILIFAIAFGLSTDYEVFLVSRIKEEYRRTGDNTEAIVRGVEKTGGIISSAGLLLVVVVGAFGSGDILQMKEMGVGLAIAVFVDATIVRTLLVPASMQTFGKLNWWVPGRSPQQKL